MDRIFVTLASILMLGVVASVFYDGRAAATRARWAHQFCRQTCRTLDYRPLMYYRLPRIDGAAEFAKRPDGMGFDGLICRCAGPNNALHLIDEDGDEMLLGGRGYMQHLEDEAEQRQRRYRNREAEEAAEQLHREGIEAATKRP